MPKFIKIKKDKNKNLQIEKIVSYQEIVKEKTTDNQLKVLFIDTNLGIDHALRFAEDGHQVYIFQTGLSAFPTIDQYITGYGMHPNLSVIEDLGKVLPNVDLIVILDNIYPYFTDYLRSKGKSVFGPSNLLTTLELNKTQAYYQLKELGIGVPDGEIVYGIQNLVEFIKKNEDGKTKFFVKINKIRGNIETFFVKSHTEVLPILSQARLGPFLNDLEFLVQFEENGIEIGADAIVCPNGVCLPLSYTIEEKGCGNVAVWQSQSDFLTEFYNKIMPLVKDDDYRCFLCVEGFFNGKEFRVIDITSRYPYPVSSLYPKFIKNYCEVIYNVANNNPIPIEIDKENPYLAELTVYTIDSNLWRPIYVNHPQLVNFHSDGIGFRKVIKYNDLYWFVPGDNLVYTLNAKGNSLNQTIDKIKSMIKEVTCYSIEYNDNFFNSALEKINTLNNFTKFQFQPKL